MPRKLSAEAIEKWASIENWGGRTMSARMKKSVHGVRSQEVSNL